MPNRSARRRDTGGKIPMLLVASTPTSSGLNRSYRSGCQNAKKHVYRDTRLQIGAGTDCEFFRFSTHRDVVFDNVLDCPFSFRRFRRSCPTRLGIHVRIQSTHHSDRSVGSAGGVWLPGYTGGPIVDHNAVIHGRLCTDAGSIGRGWCDEFPAGVQTGSPVRSTPAKATQRPVVHQYGDHRVDVFWALEGL